jgi:regulator of replication initiation timing
VAKPFYTPLELLEHLEKTGVLHRMIRRHAEGYSDDGLISTFSYGYRVCDPVNGIHLGDKEECIGCTARRLIDEVNP